MRRFSSDELFEVRNNIPVHAVIEQMAELPSKETEGIFRFLCPTCNEFQTGVHEGTNLARCFRCRRNFNTIEVLMESRALTFVQSVKLLLKHLRSTPAQPAVPVALSSQVIRDAGTASSADASCPPRSLLRAASILARMMRS